MSKEQNIVLVAVILAAIVFIANKNKKPFNFIALGLLFGLSFIFPLLAVVLVIPTLFIIYLKNYKSISSLWTDIKNISIK